MLITLAHAPSVRDVPQLSASILITDSDEPAAIGAKRGVNDLAIVVERRLKGARGGVPESHGIVCAGQHELAIGTESHRVDHCLMGHFEHAGNGFAGRRVPDLDYLLAAG